MNSLLFEFHPKPISLRVVSKKILDLDFWLLSEARTALKATGSTNRPATAVGIMPTDGDMDADGEEANETVEIWPAGNEEGSTGIAWLAGSATAQTRTNKRNLRDIQTKNIKKKKRTIDTSLIILSAGISSINPQ
jgi:hypothetical protein